jgi:hypothetical protein
MTGGRYRRVRRQRPIDILRFPGSPLVGTERFHPCDDHTRERQDHEQKLRQPE